MKMRGGDKEEVRGIGRKVRREEKKKGARQWEGQGGIINKEREGPRVSGKMEARKVGEEGGRGRGM